MKENTDKKICDFCGPFETCEAKYHNKAHIENLLIDAGIVPDDRKALDKWWSTVKQDDPGHMKDKGFGPQKEPILLQANPAAVWAYYQWRVAKYVRAIL